MARKTAAAPQGPLILGIEGGGTRTSVLLVRRAKAPKAARNEIMAQFAIGPAVLPLMSDRELQWHLREIAGRLPQPPEAIGIGLAGARTDASRERIQRAASVVWPQVPCHATNDLETALHAAPPPKRPVNRVLVLSGTGSCCFGRAIDGRTAKVGGRGHVIGDRASACDIGLRALRAAISDLDHRGSMGSLGAAILNALMFTDPEQLIPWSVDAQKSEIAGLAMTVFATAKRGDRTARRLLAEAAEMLATDGCACARQLVTDDHVPIEFVFNGGVLINNPEFSRDVARRIRERYPAAKIIRLGISSVWGAVHLAEAHLASMRAMSGNPELPQPPGLVLPGSIADLAVLAQSPTEQRNPQSMRLDKLSLQEGIELMLSEDGTIPDAIRAEAALIAQIIHRVIRAFKTGGRLFYAGAGTSGRLGVLDASEIPPTFRASREQVQGLIAGGRQALWSAVEGAEDDVQAGTLAIRHRKLDAKDVLIGIAASGRTPFVWGAIHEANERGAFTALLCFNPAMRQAVQSLPKKTAWRPQAVLAPNVGPEVLTGSTRLKSGTATKLILNMITTLAMTKVGKVVSNLMVDLNPSNVKLRDRAVRILRQLTGCEAGAARKALQDTGWKVKEAYERLERIRQSTD